MNELGSLLRNLRGKLSLRKAAELTGLSHTYIADVEKGIKHGTKTPVKPSPETLKRFAKAYDYPYEELLRAAGYIDKKEESDWNEKLPELTEKDERDIARDLEKIINNLESESGYSHYDGQTIDDMEPEDKEVLIESLKNSMRLAKRMAKQKFTPKKYRK